MLSDADRRMLLRIAREAIAARLGGPAAAPIAAEGALARSAAAFVTLRQGAALRGCIGHLERDRPLADVVAAAATAAALEDPRFPPVQPAELAGLLLEISVLGPLEPIDPHDATQFVVGCHGLVVHRGSRRGLLLPQVAVEWRWNRETFLAQACLKAGLPHDAWKSGTEVCRFEAEVFGEEE
jgi:AmmeMemoRadiSam system protein A